MQQIDPNVPVQIPNEDLTNWVGILDRVLADIITPATPPLLETGLRLWLALSLIVVVWTGLKIAYSGTFAPWDLVRLLFGLWVPWAMLRFYAEPLPGSAWSFPMAITAGGNWLGRTFQSDVVDVMFGSLTGLVDTYQARFSAAWSSMSVLTLLRTGSSALFTLVLGLVAAAFLILALVLIFAVSMGQVLWATVAISILIFLGPMFIPWLVFEPMAFLFWGWFRALIVYSLYSAIAGALLRVWGGIAVGYVTTLSNTTLDLSSLAWTSTWLVAVVPLLIASLLSALKVHELASTLVSGGGGGGSGFLGIGASGAAIVGGGRLARVAAKSSGSGA